MMTWTEADRLQFQLEGRHRMRCPCCETSMRAPSMLRKHGRIQPNERTRGHLVPTTYSGPRLWVWICSKCNSDQGGWTMWQWGRILAVVGDKRQRGVAVLLKELEELGITEPTDRTGSTGNWEDNSPAGNGGGGALAGNQP